LVENSRDKGRSVKLAFELIADDWNRLREKPWPVLISFLNEFDHLKQFNNNVLLDLGCGNGRHSIFFAKHSASIVGVDFSFEILRIAKKKTEAQKIDNISYVLADLNALPFKENIFTRIIYLSTFHHIPTRQKRQENLIKVGNILKKGGYCLISVWRKWQKRFFWHFFKQIFNPRRSGEFGDIYIPWKKQNGVFVQRFYHLLSQRELRKIIEGSGFQIVLMKNLGGPTNKDNIFVVLKRIFSQ